MTNSRLNWFANLQKKKNCRTSVCRFHTAKWAHVPLNTLSLLCMHYGGSCVCVCVCETAATFTGHLCMCATEVITCSNSLLLKQKRKLFTVCVFVFLVKVTSCYYSLPIAKLQIMVQNIQFKCCSFSSQIVTQCVLSLCVDFRFRVLVYLEQIEFVCEYLLLSFLCLPLFWHLLFTTIIGIMRIDGLLVASILGLTLCVCVWWFQRI